MSIIERLAAEVLKQAKSNGLTICTAKSCSAGRLALALSKGEGASQHLMGGVVAYTKEMKIRTLGVPRNSFRAALRFVPMSLKPWRAGPADCRGLRWPFPLPVLPDPNPMKMAIQSDWSIAVWHARMRRK